MNDAFKRATTRHHAYWWCELSHKGHKLYRRRARRTLKQQDRREW